MSANQPPTIVSRDPVLSDMAAVQSPAGKGAGVASQPRRLLTVREAAAYLSLSPSAVYELVRLRRIKHRRLAPARGSIRFLPADLDDFIEASIVDVEPGAGALTESPMQPAAAVRHFRESIPRELWPESLPG